MVLSNATPVMDELRADNSIRKHIKNNLPGSITGQKGCSELEIIRCQTWKYWRRKRKKRKLTCFRDRDWEGKTNIHLHSSTEVNPLWHETCLYRGYVTRVCIRTYSDLECILVFTYLTLCLQLGSKEICCFLAVVQPVPSLTHPLYLFFSHHKVLTPRKLSS